MNTKEYIKQNEGLRLTPYKCTAGKLTIGWGRNLDDQGITLNEAELMLNHDINLCITSIREIFGDPLYWTFSDSVKIVLTDMMFNLGVTRFKKFKKMIQAVRDEDWPEAARQLLDSRYAKQVPNRANRNADAMRRG